MKIYRFRNCVLNTFERNVVKDGKQLVLTTKTFDVLQFLVERSGELVTKDEMLGAIWSGSFVEESNLPVQIAKIRRSLDESQTARFIETVYGIGYRFVSPARLIAQAEWKDDGFVRNHITQIELDKAARIILEAAKSIRHLVLVEGRYS